LINKLEIKIEILEDGTIKFVTDKIPKEQHKLADEFIKEVQSYLGGPISITQYKPVHQYEETKQHVRN
jgi:hypothetical protein